MKVVINKCYGGFSLSIDVIAEYKRRKGSSNYIHPSVYDLSRNDKDLIAAIEGVGLERSAGPHASLKIVEIPDDIEWDIEEHDGIEWVAEERRTWE